MEIILSMLIGITVNLDNFLIGLNLGMQKKEISVGKNFLMAAITGASALGSMKAARMISDNYMFTANFIGALLLIGFGVYCYIGTKKKKEQETIFTGEVFSLKECLVMGLFLALNCIPPSLSAGIMRMDMWLVSGFAFFSAFVLMFISNRLGFKMSSQKKFGFLGPLSAIILIVVGIIELVR